MVGRGDDHGVHVLAGQDLAVVQRPVYLEILLGGRDALLVHVANGDQLAGVLVLLPVAAETLRDVIAAAAHSNEGDVDPIVRADHSSRARRLIGGQDAPAGGQSRARDGGGLEEFPTIALEHHAVFLGMG